MKTHKYPIGTTYTGRHGKCTVVDHLTTINGTGEVVTLRYVTSHMFCGQIVTDRDVVQTTIDKHNPVLPNQN